MQRWACKPDRQRRFILPAGGLLLCLAALPAAGQEEKSSTRPAPKPAPPAATAPREKAVLPAKPPTDPGSPFDQHRPPGERARFQRRFRPPVAEVIPSRGKPPFAPGMHPGHPGPLHPPGPPMPPPPSCVARVAATDGQVTIRRPSEMEFAPAPTHTPLCPGDIVRTGPRSRAILLFSDGSQLKLNAMSMLLIPYATGRRHDAGMAYMRPPMERRPLGERGRSEEERKQTPPPPR